MGSLVFTGSPFDFLKLLASLPTTKEKPEGLSWLGDHVLLCLAYIADRPLLASARYVFRHALCDTYGRAVLGFLAHGFSHRDGATRYFESSRISNSRVSPSSA